MEKDGKASVKKLWVVNSDKGLLPRVGHGIVIVQRLFAVTGPWFSPITS